MQSFPNLGNILYYFVDTICFLLLLYILTYLDNLERKNHDYLVFYSSVSYFIRPLEFIKWILKSICQII